MILMPIVYVADMDRALRFYESLGLEVGSTSAHWCELRAGDGAVLALHLTDASTAARVELALVSTTPLEQTAEQLGDAVVRGIADEAFGRSLVLSDPDGLAIQVNEHDAELHPAG